MSDPDRNLHVLQPYRGKPPEIRYGRGEHAGVCMWCRWSDRISPYYCYEPIHNPGHENKWAIWFNKSGLCERYLPSLLTRLLQALRLRPRLERPTDETEGT